MLDTMIEDNRIKDPVASQAKALRAQRLRYGLTQAQAAELVGIAPDSWRHLEAGRRGRRRGAARALALLRKAHGDEANVPSLPLTQRGDSWRVWRARLAGQQRATNAAMRAQREAERRLLEARRAEDVPPVWSQEIASLRRDVLHSADCTDHPCARCEGILRRYEDLEEDEGAPVAVAAGAHLVEHAELLEKTAELVVQAFSRGQGGAGSARERAYSLHALRAVVAGEHEAARELIEDETWQRT